jgi:hypothetical protein
VVSFLEESYGKTTQEKKRSESAQRMRVWRMFGGYSFSDCISCHCGSKSKMTAEITIEDERWQTNFLPMGTFALSTVRITL